jgi:hypothetical protein
MREKKKTYILLIISKIKTNKMPPISKCKEVYRNCAVLSITWIFSMSLAIKDSLHKFLLWHQSKYSHIAEKTFILSKRSLKTFKVSSIKVNKSFMIDTLQNINFCCDISQNILTLQKKHLFSIFVFVFNWMFVWFLYFLFK